MVIVMVLVSIYTYKVLDSSDRICNGSGCCYCGNTSN